MATPAIEFHDVTKVYRSVFREERVEALSAVSFEAAAGEVCAFLGPNGAGKTTSISILMGFVFADSGEIRVLGYPPGDVRAKQQIGFLPENFAFYKHLTGPKLLKLHLALTGRQVARPDDLIGELLAKVGLSGYEDLRIGKYSRGMVQRLGLAQALLSDPQLLVLDEPTSGLDPAGRKEVLDLLTNLKSAGKTVFLSSHILPEVEQICDRVVIVDRGKLLRSGPLQEMLESGHRVEIIVDQLPEGLEAAAVERGAIVDRGPHGIRIAIDASVKREIVEMLWSAGADVISMNPLRSSLEELFLKTVGGRRGAP
ncbi:MAG TPA: ABC transporter ATP-binding protein [Bryobacteraceae bacterium]|jgi:ABC-2 type transport system ATP-binding protein|nr:ABC transporter ATP-binding protein [Bryobacteraceae bacterium]